MPQHVVLLRGINLGSRNRIAMSELRACLEKAGFKEVATYLQSGNVLLSSGYGPDRVGTKVNALIKQRFGIDVAVLVRSRAELAEVVHRNPLAGVAVDPKRYLVTFLSGILPSGYADGLGSVTAPREPFAVIGREVYSWHPDGVGRSPLWERLAAKTAGITATSRNWSTVTSLLAMADAATSR
ncbi:MAG TPA: DUF1697 domain-containing protein [Candidatus Sulfotelmatobacter sp.]|nr:DUF1697 domain-containing protein [Candidatus Sulfotelmatobacter sp.]